MTRSNVFFIFVSLFIFCLSVSYSSFAAPVLQLKVIELPKGSSGKGLPTILVHGQKGQYSKILTDNLTYYFTVRINYPKKAKGPSFGTIKLENKFVDIAPTTETTTYEITMPYKNPRAFKTGVTPIKRCNVWLDGLTGSKREKALKEGTTLKVSNAYKATANATYKQKKVSFIEDETATATIDVPVKLKCMGLNAPAPRQNTTTRGKEREPKGKRKVKMYKLALDVKPGSKEMIEGYLCPTKAHLYGKIEAKTAIEGSAVIFGPGFISPVTKVNIPKNGQSTVRATYPIKWSSEGKNELAADNKKPTTKKFELTFNLSNKDNKVISSTGKKSFTVTCTKPKKNPDIDQPKSRVKERVQ